MEINQLSCLTFLGSRERLKKAASEREREEQKLRSSCKTIARRE